MNDENEKSILIGLALMASAVGTFIFGKHIKSRPVKIATLVLAAALGISGTYLFATGLTKEFAGQYGRRYGSIGSAHFESPQEFKRYLASYQEYKKSKGKNVRRLRFSCPDDSQSFTVYFTPAWIINVPDNEVVCNDGAKLVEYSALTEKKSD